MKRGLITWDRDEIAPEVFEARVDKVRDRARAGSVLAIAIYTDVWRSNAARFVSNFMPYFNQSLLVVPVDGDPILLCGLSPHVYPWIRSHTIVEDIRPGKLPAQRLVELAIEKGWSRIGVAGYTRLPYEMVRELDAAELDVVDVELPPSVDDGELAMRRKALAITRPIVDALEYSAGENDFHIVSRLEKALRRAGMEDLVLWLSQPGDGPRPANGTPLAERFSVVVAAEYRGHWVGVSRFFGAPLNRDPFEDYLESFAEDATIHVHDLSGAHPFRAVPSASLVPGSIAALHLEFGDGLLYGDTCLVTGPTSVSVL